MRFDFEDHGETFENASYDHLMESEYFNFLSSLSVETQKRIARETKKIMVLSVLTVIGNTEVKKIIASRKIIASVSARKIKDSLANDEDKCVRKALASNYHLYREDIERFTHDSNSEVVVIACQNIVTDDALLSDVLDRTKDISVLIAIASNRNVSTDTLCKLYYKQKTMCNIKNNSVLKFRFEYLKEQIASSEALTNSEIIFELAQEESLNIKLKLLDNENVKKIQGLLVFLANDKDKIISGKAKKILQSYNS